MTPTWWSSADVGLFRGNWCQRCRVEHDTGWHDGTEHGPPCEILTSMLAGWVRPEWEWHTDGRTRCTAFAGECDCPDDADELIP